MGVLVDALTFVGVCLLAGAGLFLAAEGARRFQRRRLLTTAGEAITLLGGVIVAAGAGAYWLSLAVP